MEYRCHLTWLEGVFYTQHGGSFPIGHALHHIVLGQVGAPILHPDACSQVVEVPAVKLQELNQQDAQVEVGTPGVNSGMELQYSQVLDLSLCVDLYSYCFQSSNFQQTANMWSTSATEEPSVVSKSTCKKLMAMRMRL